MSELESHLKPDKFGVTRKDFIKWRVPRFGDTNPTKINNPVYEWLIRTRLNAYLAADQFNISAFDEQTPTWCFDRFGQSKTTLPDGRTIYIAGEHEDHYDPDFNIYNDVTVIHPDDSIDIYTYPKNIFPPTDFHTATLIDDRIIIIGNLGYSDNRSDQYTPVYELNLNTFEIHKLETTGQHPGWLHRHKAEPTEDGTAIRITNGKRNLAEKQTIIENINDFELNLQTLQWKQLTDRQWTMFEVARKDGRPHDLFSLSMHEFKPLFENVNLSDMLDIPDELKDELGEFDTSEIFPERTDEEYELYQTLYTPPIPHEKVPQPEIPDDVDDCDKDDGMNDDDNEYNTKRILINDIMVRYVDELDGIRVVVEGQLAPDIIKALEDDMLDKFSRLENTKCIITRP